MVTTPWAPGGAAHGAGGGARHQKVMEDHAPIGVVVTTDGTVTDIPREDYREAEARAIAEICRRRASHSSFSSIRRAPGAAPAEALCAQLRSEYGVQALAMDCMHMQTQDIGRLLEAVMYAFPVEELRFFLPSWVRALPDGHPVKAALYDAMLGAGALTSLSEAESVMGSLRELDPVDAFRVREVDLGTGTVSCELPLPQALSCPGRPGWRSPTMKPFCRCCGSFRRRKSSTKRYRPRSNRSRRPVMASSCRAQRN